MSRNSSESKTSPHSWHSTNSVSSSRATTRTFGCLQRVSMLGVQERPFLGILGKIVSLPARLSSTIVTDVPHPVGPLRPILEARPTERSIMLRLTKKADYGLMALKYLAEHPEEASLSARDIASAYHIPPQLLAKILQLLARQGLLQSHAGMNGGYSLTRDPRDISVFEVIRI